MPSKLLIRISLLMVMALAAACSNPATPEDATVPADDNTPAATNPEAATVPASGEIIRSVANVDTATVAVSATSPVVVEVTVTGNFPDGCTELAGTEQVMDGETVLFRVFVERPAEALCTLALVPFEATFPLDANGLGIGTHRVNVNGVFTEFTLAETAVSPADPVVACPPASEDLAPYFNETDGYCLLYPIGFEISSPAPGTTVIGIPPLGDEEILAATLTITNLGAANGRTAQEIADETVPADSSIVTSTTVLGVETAVVLDNIPGDPQTRQLFAVHNNTAYQIILSPMDPDNYPDETFDAELFWETAVPSFTFTP